MSKTFLFQVIQFSQTVLIQTIQFSISMQLVLFNPAIGPYQVLPFQDRVDLGAMARKGYSTFPKAPASLEPHHQIVLCHIQNTHRGGGFTPLQRCSQSILQPQPTEQAEDRSTIHFRNLNAPCSYNSTTLVSIQIKVTRLTCCATGENIFIPRMSILPSDVYLISKGCNF